MTFPKTLDFIQKHTKTDIRYLMKGSIWLSANQISGMVLGFLLAVAFANILPADVYGNYKFILSLAAIVGSFSLTGLNLAITRDVARGIHGLLKVGFRMQLLWSLGTFFASICISIYYFTKDNNALAIAILIVGVTLPIISSLRIYIPFLEGKKDYKKTSIFNIVTTLVYTITLFIVIHFNTSIPIIIFFYFITQVICSFIFYKIAAKSDTETTVTTHKTISFGKHLSFLNILSTIAGQMDKLLVYHHLGATQLAVYAFSQVPVGQIRAALKQATYLAFPKYSEKSMKEIKLSIYRKMFVYTMVILLVVFSYILIAPYIFKIFFPKYMDAVIYSQIAMLSLLFLQKKLISYAALAHATKKQIYTMSISASFFKILLLLIFLPFYGIWGAIATEIIAQAVGLMASILLLRRL